MLLCSPPTACGQCQLLGVETHTKVGSLMVHGLVGSKLAKLQEEKMGQMRRRVYCLWQAVVLFT